MRGERRETRDGISESGKRKAERVETPLPFTLRALRYFTFCRLPFLLLFLLPFYPFTFLPVVYASSFKVIGTRPLGMGGAFVAVAEDALSPYWNPAALGMQKGFDLQIPLNINIEATGDILNSAQKIGNSLRDISAIMDAHRNNRAIELKQLEAFSVALKNLKEMEGAGKGLLGEVAGGINTKIGRWAFTVNNFTSVGVNPQIDLTSIHLGTAPTRSTVVATQFFAPATIEGIDFSKLPNISLSTGTPLGLESESTSLSSVIRTISSQLGADLGAFTPEQIANALINIAVSGGVSNQDISSAVAQIVNILPLIENILSGKTFAENNSNLTVSGISLTELTFSHGRSISFLADEPILKSMYLGANLKYMLGSVAFMRRYLLKEQTSESDDIGNVFQESVRQSANLGIDLGFLWVGDKLPLRPRAGLLARNINSPRFEQPQAAKDVGMNDYTVAPQIRLGAAIKPFDWWLIASDMDITKNRTVMEGYESQNVSLGNEFNILNIPWLNLALRAGLVKNIASSNSPLTYTAGLGVNITHFVFELGGAMSSDRVLIERGTEIPSRVMASMTLSLNF